MNIIEIKRIGLDLENNRYEIVPLAGEHGYEARILFNGRPAPWKYSIEISDVADYNSRMGEDVVDSFLNCR